MVVYQTAEMVVTSPILYLGLSLAVLVMFTYDLFLYARKY